MKALRLLSLLTLILVLLGCFVRATGAGLSCPDWPLCFGRVIPELEYGVTQEYFHRVLAGFVTIVTGLICYNGFCNRRRAPHQLRWGVFLVALVLVQAIFGGATVTMKLHPHVVTTHLALGTLFLQIVSLLAFSRRVSQPESINTFRNVIFFLALCAFIQIILGGFVGASGAGLSCPDFPNCGAPTFGGAQEVQMLHRILGIALTVALLGTVLWTFKSELLKEFRGAACRTSAILCAQVLVGWLNVVAGISVWLTVLHMFLAQGILMHLLLLWSSAGSRKAPYWEEAAS